MANIFKKASNFVKSTVSVAAKTGALGLLPGGSVAAGVITATTANKAAKTSSATVKPQPSTVVKSASSNVQQKTQTNMDNQQQTNQKNEFVEKATEFVKKNWVYIVAGGVATYLLLPMLKKKRR